MVEFICGKCGKQFTDEEIQIKNGFIRCPYCQYRVLYKKTPPLAVTVKTD
jgi:DNA-directed RNA polymerase subunit RPC12/RpoP